MRCLGGAVSGCLGACPHALRARPHVRMRRALASCPRGVFLRAMRPYMGRNKIEHSQLPAGEGHTGCAVPEAAGKSPTLPAQFRFIVRSKLPAAPRLRRTPRNWLFRAHALVFVEQRRGAATALSECDIPRVSCRPALASPSTPLSCPPRPAPASYRPWWSGSSMHRMPPL